MEATQFTERRSAAGTWTVALVVLLLLCASAALTACGDSGTTSTSPSAVSSRAAASPSDAASPRDTPAHAHRRWDHRVREGHTDRARFRHG